MEEGETKGVKNVCVVIMIDAIMNTCFRPVWFFFFFSYENKMFPDVPSKGTEKH